MSAPPSGRILDGVHILPLRIYYEDTDAAGIVYYANWLRFLERGRTELLRLLGQEHSALREERGIAWVVRRCVIDYLKPATPRRDLYARATCVRVTRHVAFIRASAYHDEDDPIALAAGAFMLGTKGRPAISAAGAP